MDVRVTTVWGTTAPLQADDNQTVDVTVTVGDIASPTSPADEYTYTGL